MIYIEMKNALTPLMEELTEIETFSFYNEQYIEPTEEDPIVCPAVYLEIPEIAKWNEGSGKVLQSRMTIRFHVVSDAIEDAPEDVMEIAQSVMEKLQGKALFKQVLNESEEVISQDYLSTRLLRAGTSFPKQFGNLSVMLIDFEAEVSDLSFVDVLVETEEAITYTISVS